MILIQMKRMLLLEMILIQMKIILLLKIELQATSRLLEPLVRIVCSVRECVKIWPVCG